MKKLLLLLLIVGCIALNGITESTKIELSKEQEKEYRNQVNNNRELYSFTPMHVGDQWNYETYMLGELEQENYKHREVVADTIINGEVYYKCYGYAGNGNGTDNNFWLRNIGDSLVVYDPLNYYSVDVDPLNDLMNDFTINEIEQTYPSANVFWGTNFHTNITAKIEGKGFVEVFGETVEYIDISFIDNEHSLNLETIMYARKYGPIAYYCEFFEAYLEGCIIDGVQYGTVKTDDAVGTNLVDITNYPNPFNPKTTIKFNNIDFGVNKQLRIYNLRGQVVKHYDLSNRNEKEVSIEWNGKDQSNKKVATGVYLVNIVSNGKICSKTIKMMLLK